MHDCRTQGGHYFVYKPQNFSFRCRRCSERFISSYTDRGVKQPWKCLLECCEYVACSSCSDILSEELAVLNLLLPDDEALPQDLPNGTKLLPEEAERIESTRVRKGGLMSETLSDGVSESRDFAKDVARPKPVCEVDNGSRKEPLDASKFERIEVGDGDDAAYEIPIFTRTARQAGAQAAMKRMHGKMRPVVRRGEAELGRI